MCHIFFGTIQDCIYQQLYVSHIEADQGSQTFFHVIQPLQRETHKNPFVPKYHTMNVHEKYKHVFLR